MYEAWLRVRDNLWAVLQQSVAAALSWWIAGNVFDHHVPLFAPIATLVALNTPVGGRGTNAVRVMSGVLAGVIVGQLAFHFLGHGDAAVGAAVLCALLVALLLDGQRITMAQAAVGAVISVAAGAQAGIDRVQDALLGAGVALVFSQLLLPPHPLSLLRRAETATLKGLGRALELTARALEESAEEREAQPWEKSRPVYTLLNDLGGTRSDAIAVARRTPHWRGRQEPGMRGVLLAPVDSHGAPWHVLSRQNIPCVVVDRAVGEDEVCSVAADDVLGGLLAGRHLLKAGHRRIAYVGGPEQLRQVRDRRDGLLRAVHEAGMSADTVVDVPVHRHDVRSGRDAGQRLIGLSPRPSAVFCANDLLALGIMQTVFDAGVRVPDDLAVIGYDDIEFAEACLIPLTSVRHPAGEIGRLAAELLLKELDPAPEGHRHESIVLKPELVVRRSTVPRA
ncbi:substrate-binding domain-containing protein [Streptomyces anulatus]|uniref:substrate-binding domain-containing protein n=1 Tax=Streptomyces anulatus TaxID=1892 RepID=UPI003630DAC9